MSSLCALISEPMFCLFFFCTLIKKFFDAVIKNTGLMGMPQDVNS